MSDRNIKLQKLFLEKKFTEIIDIIESIDKSEKRSAGLLNLLGASKLSRNSKEKNDLYSANLIFKTAYLQEKESNYGLESLINYLNTTADIFDENIDQKSSNFIEETEVFFNEAEVFFGFNEKLILAMIRIYKRQNNLEKILFYLKKLINNGCLSSKILSSYIYRNCFINIWSQNDFLSYAKILNKNLKQLISEDIKKISNLKNSKISIAFLSSDIIRNHSVTHFLKTVLQNYDKEKFQITLINNSKEEDDTTIYFKSLVNTSLKINHLKDSEAINFIRNKNFDILFDLMGVTSTNRLALFKNRLAPIQISWLGYCNTTGLDNMDYIFADPHTIKKSEEELYSEKVVYLPKIWNCHSGINKMHIKNPSPFLKNKYITFGSFNNFNKVNKNVIDAWSQILKEVKNSKLILKSSIKMQTEIIKNLFDNNGVLKSVYFYEAKPFDEHLNLYNSIDLALDTFPYNGVTTSFEAIWMGVPVLTMSGYNFNSRCGESINKNLNLDNLIAENISDYIAKAVNFSNNHDLLLSIRHQIFEEALSSPLFDKDNFSKNFFNSLKNIYNSH